MDSVLQALDEGFKLVDSVLQDFNAPLMPCSRRLGGRARGPPAAGHLDDTAEDPRATPGGARSDRRYSPSSKTSHRLLLEAAREEEEARPNGRCRTDARLVGRG
jgi:hypothetical protein